MSRKPGRPIAAANAWGLLAILSNEPPDWLDPAVRSRLRRRADDHGWVESAIRFSEPRSSLHHWRVLDPDLDRVRDELPLVPSGLSAGGIDVVPLAAGLDVYASREALSKIRARFRPLSDSEQPNLIVRIPSHDWVLNHEVAPAAVVAADLLEHADPRVSHAAQRLLHEEAGGARSDQR
jgi:hypothetical protein